MYVCVIKWFWPTHSDKLELLNTVADLRLENERLNERNRALVVQMEGSEENLKELQLRNRQDAKKYIVV